MDRDFGYICFFSTSLCFVLNTLIILSVSKIEYKVLCPDLHHKCEFIIHVRDVTFFSRERVEKATLANMCRYTGWRKTLPPESVFHLSQLYNHIDRIGKACLLSISSASHQYSHWEVRLVGKRTE
jgi:hypothetical protein